MSHKKLSFAEALRAARETRALEIGENILGQVPRIFHEQFGGREALIVSDANTFPIAGQTVLNAFRAAQRPVRDPFIFRVPDLYAEHRFVKELETSLKQHDAIPIAVGGGTINDLTKLAAHRAGRSFCATRLRWTAILLWCVHHVSGIEANVSVPRARGGCRGPECDSCRARRHEFLGLRGFDREGDSGRGLDDGGCSGR
jgi:hypothetical protein